MQIKKIDIRSYIHYKLLSSIYAGSALGSIFVIYATLPPSLFSLGGIALAIGGWAIAMFYIRLINIGSFFIIGGVAEIMILLLTLSFVAFHDAAWISLFVYCLYQLIFLFGNYLVRAETKLLSRTALFSVFDKAKQIGYLAGLGLSFAAYQILGSLGIDSSKEQIVFLYTALALLQILVLIFYFRAFVRYGLRCEKRG